MLGLDPATRQALVDLFAGKSCCECGEQAQRLYDRRPHGDLWYCHEHYPPGRQRREVELRIVIEPRF